MTEKNDHPKDEELRAAALGTMPYGIANHLKGCSPCKQRLLQFKDEQARSPELDPLDDLVAEQDGSAQKGPEIIDRKEQPKEIGKYIVLGPLSSGGQAELFLVRHPILGIELVLKWYWPNLKDQTAYPKKLFEEGRLLSELKHPNLAQVHDLDVHQGRPFLVQEYIRGRSLEQVVSQKSLNPLEIATVMAKVARALEEAHRHGVIHQDVKPENIVINPQGDACLIDFGVATIKDAWMGNDADEGTISGSPPFMAPEQARGGAAKTSPRSDIFSLGATLYSILTGKPPFIAENDQATLNKAINCDFDRMVLGQSELPQLEAICLKAMAEDPANRHESAKDLAEDLEAYALGKGDTTGICGLDVLLFSDQRDEEIKDLADELALPIGDYIRIHAKIPNRVNFSIFWIDTEGKLRELQGETIESASSRQVYYPTPRLGDEIPGPEGTVMILLCGRYRYPPRLEELKKVIPTPWLKLPKGTAFLLNRDGVERYRNTRSVVRTRGSLGPRKSLPDAFVRAELMQQALKERFDLLAAWIVNTSMDDK